MGSTTILPTILWKGLTNRIQVEAFRREFLSFRKVFSMPMSSSTCRCMHESQSHLNSTTPALQQQTQAEQKEENSEQLTDNDRVNPHFINRNPRNLEGMAVARKDKGWSESFPRKDYWHKLIVSKSTRHITAHIEHIKGNIVVQASTKEWAIKQHLYSTSDVAASENLGRVLAERCLESGVSFIHVNMKTDAKEQEGMAAFLNALEEGGLIFGEPRSIVDFNRKTDYFPEVD